MQWDFQLQISTYCIDNNLWSGEIMKRKTRIYAILILLALSAIAFTQVYRVYSSKTNIDVSCTGNNTIELDGIIIKSRSSGLPHITSEGAKVKNITTGCKPT
jgi:hypothetical protein